MIILLNLIGHYLYLTLLFSAWLLPIFAVEGQERASEMGFGFNF